MREILCLVEPWDIFFTVTQVLKTGIPIPVFFTLNIFHDFAPLSLITCTRVTASFAVMHEALTGMHPVAGLRLHGRPQATVAMQLERKQSDSRRLLHPASGPHHRALNAAEQTTIPDPFARGQPSPLCMSNNKSYRGACLGYVLLRLSPRCILAGDQEAVIENSNHGVQTDRQRRLADMAR